MSEFVTNAVAHAGHETELAVTRTFLRDDDVPAIEVWDQCGTHPKVTTANVHDESGRGLFSWRVRAVLGSPVDKQGRTRRDSEPSRPPSVSTFILMMTDDERDFLARKLLRLSLPELVDVLRRVLSAHAEKGGTEPSVLTLAEISWSPELDPPWNQPYVEIVAWPDRDHYNGGFGPELAMYEQGTCSGCGLQVTSTAKRAFCSLCGTACSLT